MKIGVFSGSFNPIHLGHIILGNYIVENTDIDEVWYIVSPHNPLKDERELIDEKERLKMVELATSAYEKLKVSDFEFSLPRPSYTVDTLEALQKKYPEDCLTLIMGADNWDKFSHWKDYLSILDRHEIIIYPRLDARLTIPSKLKSTVSILDSPIIEISSTYIREVIQDNKNARPYLNHEVFEYINQKRLYK